MLLYYHGENVDLNKTRIVVKVEGYSGQGTGTIVAWGHQGRSNFSASYTELSITMFECWCGCDNRYHQHCCFFYHQRILSRIYE